MPDKCLTSFILTSRFIMKLSILILNVNKKISATMFVGFITSTNIRSRLVFAF